MVSKKNFFNLFFYVVIPLIIGMSVIVLKGCNGQQTITPIVDYECQSEEPYEQEETYSSNLSSSKSESKISEPKNKTIIKSEPTFINGILIANKTYPLPADYNPGMDSDASNAFLKMQSDAKKEGLNLRLSSGFRSYKEQSEIYKSFVKNYGQTSADTFSARPGHSEHQTGLAIDLNSIDDSFAETPECTWVHENCYKYGFILRYPKGKEKITGYKYEPWHIRYLGVEMATEVYESNLCLEEFLDITSCYAETSDN